MAYVSRTDVSYGYAAGYPAEVAVTIYEWDVVAERSTNSSFPGDVRYTLPSGDSCLESWLLSTGRAHARTGSSYEEFAASNAIFMQLVNNYSCVYGAQWQIARWFLFPSEIVGHLSAFLVDMERPAISVRIVDGVFDADYVRSFLPAGTDTVRSKRGVGGMYTEVFRLSVVGDSFAAVERCGASARVYLHLECDGVSFQCICTGSYSSGGRSLWSVRCLSSVSDNQRRVIDSLDWGAILGYDSTATSNNSVHYTNTIVSY